MEWKPNQVLLIGGRTAGVFIGKKDDFKMIPVRELEVFDTQTNQSKIIGKLQVGRENPRVVLLPNSKLIVGGEHWLNGKLIYDLEVFDLKTGKSKFVKPFNYFKGKAPVHVLPDQRVMFTDGKKIEIFNPFTEKIELLEPMIQPRIIHTSILTPNGDVYFFGGRTIKDRCNSSIKLVEKFEYSKFKKENPL